MSGPTIIAHRGFAGEFPENSVAAAEGSVEAGADMIEVDVMPTAEGDVVVFHDDRLDAGQTNCGLTDSEGVVWERATDDVTNARILGTDERVPLLSSVLDALPADVGVNVELKNPGSTVIRPCERLSPTDRAAAVERWSDFLTAVLSVTDDAPNDVLFSSFCEGALAALERLDADADRAVIVGRDDWEAGVAIAREYAVDAVHVPLERVENDAVTGVADRLDAAINVWTVRDWQDARSALENGGDGIIADYSGLASYRPG